MLHLERGLKHWDLLAVRRGLRSKASPGFPACYETLRSIKFSISMNGSRRANNVFEHHSSNLKVQKLFFDAERHNQTYESSRSLLITTSS